MLALHCKKTDAIDLKSPIWEYISNTYSVDQVCAPFIPESHALLCKADLPAHATIVLG